MIIFLLNTYTLKPNKNNNTQKIFGSLGSNWVSTLYMAHRLSHQGLRDHKQGYVKWVQVRMTLSIDETEDTLQFAVNGQELYYNVFLLCRLVVDYVEESS